MVFCDWLFDLIFSRFIHIIACICMPFSWPNNSPVFENTFCSSKSSASGHVGYLLFDYYEQTATNILSKFLWERFYIFLLDVYLEGNCWVGKSVYIAWRTPNCFSKCFTILHFSPIRNLWGFQPLQHSHQHLLSAFLRTTSRYEVVSGSAFYLYFPLNLINDIEQFFTNSILKEYTVQEEPFNWLL